MDIHFKIDYLSFSIPFFSRPSFCDFLGTEVIWTDRSFRGYKESGLLVGGGIVAYTPGRPEAHFDLPGAACDSYLKSYERYKELFAMIFKAKGKISRIDLAIDVKETLHFDSVYKTMRECGIVSRARKVKVVEEMTSNDEGIKNLGTTIYVGSRKSWKMLRVYDKAKQSGLPGEWVRFELLLRDEVAYKAAEKILLMEKPADEVGGLFTGILAGFVDFRKKDRKTRVKWWAEVVGAADKVLLSIPVKECNIEKLVAWVERQVAPTLATMQAYYSDGFDAVLDYIKLVGGRRMKEKHYLMLSVDDISFNFGLNKA